MHDFGSKQQLYRRVIDAAPVPEIGGSPAEAAEQILTALVAPRSQSRLRLGGRTRTTQRAIPGSGSCQDFVIETRTIVLRVLLSHLWPLM
jgi:hypothetical protein